MVSIPVNTSNIVDGEIIDASDVTLPLTDLKTAVDNTLNGVQAFDQLSIGSTTEVTISGGSITITRSRHRVDTEGNAATDDLDTILGGTDGDVLRLQLENASRTVVIRHNGGGTGNIRTPDGNNITLGTANTYVDLLYDSTAGAWIASGATFKPTIATRDLIANTPIATATLNFPRGGIKTTGPGTANNQPFAAITPSARTRISRTSVPYGSSMVHFGWSPSVLGTATVASNTDSMYVTFTGGGSSNTHVGIESSTNVICRPQHYPFFALRYMYQNQFTIRRLFMLTSAVANSESASLSSFGFRYLAGTDTTWMVFCSDGSTLNIQDTGIAPVVNDTVYDLAAWIDDANRVAYFQVNNTLISIAANVPASTTNLVAQFGAVTTSTNAISPLISRILIEHD